MLRRVVACIAAALREQGHAEASAASPLPPHPCDSRAGEWRLAGGNLQQLTLQFPALLRSSVTVSIEFSYPLRDALSGFYRSTFSSERESVAAHLPCISESRAKAFCLNGGPLVAQASSTL
jgi:hypothetical protein